jgi:ketosteroid isomerase-like protein
MKKLIASFCLVIAFCYALKAQTSEDKVATAVTFLKNAMISGNQSDLEKIISDDLSYGHSGGKIEDKAAFIKAIATGASDFVTIELTEQTVNVKGKIAIVRHKLVAKTNDNGKPNDVKIGVMLVFAKEGKDWKLLARQAYKL